MDELTLNDLPELPFELILSYLSLEDRIKAKAVSRRWCKTIDSFRPKSLCYSQHQSGFIYGKSRWVSGAFAQNFICSSRFEKFFQTFGQSILSSLKKLRLCDLSLNAAETVLLVNVLNSFDRLEELDIIRFGCLSEELKLELNLPMLKSIQLEPHQVVRLMLDAPKLQNGNFQGYWSFLDLVRVESLERLIIWNGSFGIKVKNLKNLKYLCFIHNYPDLSEIDSTLLSTLEQLKEIHLFDRFDVSELFEQKQRYGRVDLKIFLNGCLLSGPNDPTINSPSNVYQQIFTHLLQHPSRLADQIPVIHSLGYPLIEGIPRGSEITTLNKFTDLRKIIVSSPVQDIERFLDILKNLNNIAELQFQCDQPQDLFDRLPEHCAVQKLLIRRKPADLRFLCRLSHLIKIEFKWEIDEEFIREIFTELKFLSKVEFECGEHTAVIKLLEHPKRFLAKLKQGWGIELPDIDSAIEFCVEKANRKWPKAFDAAISVVL